jgi:uncharacterized integral membrane protein
VVNGNKKALSALVTFGVKRLLLLVFVILLLIAIEEIAVVIFSREPAESFTPALIGALTAIVGGLLVFFGKIIRDHRDADEGSSSDK